MKKLNISKKCRKIRLVRSDSFCITYTKKIEDLNLNLRQAFKRLCKFIKFGLRKNKNVCVKLQIFVKEVEIIRPGMN